jgi:hypothetical protein
MHRGSQLERVWPGGRLAYVLEARCVCDQLLRGAQEDRLVVDGEDGDRRRWRAIGRRVGARPAG